jgi:DinB superfamily
MDTTDRLGLLLGQLDHARKIAEARLEGMVSPASLPHGALITARQGGGRLTDEEFLWEPAPGAWSIRRRGEATSPKPIGPGEWVLDGRGDQYPAPVTTIAWRLGHLHSDFAGRWEWTFGGRRLAPDLVVDFTPSAEEALERFWALMDRWRASVAAMTPEQLDTVGFGQYPWGSDPEEPFIDVILDSNFEFIHHMAEIALLRDLWQAHAPNQVMGA